ncbi:MAG: hypothetical protein M1825_003855 [Sarcosagium campestre]|nr:MAG: hypothetical protein M1825_003855 [Sarcosagium campestre]
MAHLTASPPSLSTSSSFDAAPKLTGQIDPDDGIASLAPAMETLDSLSQAEDTIVAETPSTPTARSSAESSSEEDYDALELDPSTVRAGAKGGGYIPSEPSSPDMANGRRKSSSESPEQQQQPARGLSSPNGSHASPVGAGGQQRRGISIKLEKTDRRGRYMLTADDPEIREILQRDLLNGGAAGAAKKQQHRQFRDLVFTRQFTAFDRLNPASSDSTFHGFFTLFWLGMALLIMKVAAENWKEFGSVLGRKHIMRLMFHHDVIVLGLTDGVMCGATVIGLALQKAIFKGWMNWNRHGWIVQNVKTPKL